MVVSLEDNKIWKQWCRPWWMEDRCREVAIQNPCQSEPDSNLARCKVTCGRRFPNVYLFTIGSLCRLFLLSFRMILRPVTNSMKPSSTKCTSLCPQLSKNSSTRRSRILSKSSLWWNMRVRKKCLSNLCISLIQQWMETTFKRVAISASTSASPASCPKQELGGSQTSTCNYTKWGLSSMKNTSISLVLNSLIFTRLCLMWLRSLWRILIVRKESFSGSGQLLVWIWTSRRCLAIVPQQQMASS